MNNILSLIKFFGNNKSNSSLSKNEKIILNLLMFLALNIIIFIFETSLYNQLKQINIQKNFVFINIFIYSFFTIIYTISNVFLDFYYKKNTINFFIFPIKNYEIIIYKLFILLKIPFIISLFLVLIPTFIFGMYEKLNITYFIVSILLSFTLPLFIILSICILTLLFLNFINENIFKNIKNIIYIFTLSIGTIILFLIKFFDFNSLINNLNLTNYNFIFIFLGGAYFLINYILNNNNLFINIAISTLILLLEIYLFIKIFSKFYYKNLLKISLEKNKINKKKFNNYNELTNLIILELKSIFRNYFLFANLVLKIFLIPLSFILIFFNRNTFYNIDLKIFLLIIIYLQSSINITSVTSISRDKSNFYFKKIFPLKTINIIYSKILVGFIINIVPLILTNIIFTILNNNFSLKFILISILLCIYKSIKCFLKNLKNPFINYNDEKNIIYSNYNIISLFIETVVFICLIVIFSIKINLNIILILIAIISLINIIYFILNQKKYIKIFENL